MARARNSPSSSALFLRAACADEAAYVAQGRLSGTASVKDGVREVRCAFANAVFCYVSTSKTAKGAPLFLPLHALAPRSVKKVTRGAMQEAKRVGWPSGWRRRRQAATR